MRVKGPGNGAGPVDQTGPVDRSEGVDEVAPAEAPLVEPAAPAAATGPPDAIAEVAARLRAGEITVDQAVEQLIDDAIERQVGQAVERAHELEPELRELLRTYVATDPFIAARIRRLTYAK
jgi:hypothetical protein